jgi:hypothetical protein
MPADLDTLASATRDAVEQVLETMFYTTAVPVPPRAFDNPFCAHLQFNGDPCGEFELRISRAAAAEFAAACLGVRESDLPPQAAADVACELANVICGAALSRVHPDSIVNLNSPAIGEPSLSDISQCFEAPEGLLSVALRVV